MTNGANTTKSNSVNSNRTSHSLPIILDGPRRTRFVFLVLNGVGQALLAVATAILVKQGFDQLVGVKQTPSREAVLYFAGALGAITVATSWLRWRGHLDAEILGQSYVHAVRTRLFRHVSRIGAEGARQMSKGALMLRFVGDLSALRQWVSLGLARLLVSGLAIAIALFFLAFLEPVIALAVGVAVAITGAASFAIGPSLRKSTFEARRRRGRMAAVLNDRISRIGVVEAFGQEKRERRRFRKLSRSIRSALIDRAQFIGMLRAISEAGAGFAGIFALIVGAFLAGQGQATPGAVVSAMAIAGLLAPKIQDLGRVYEYWNGAKVARQKQEELLQLKPLGRPSGGDKRKHALEDGPGEIRFRKVSFRDQISSIDLRISAGSRAVLIGPNGSGKSTFLRLAAGILQPTSGKVVLDGQNLARRDWEDVRRAFSIVSPDLPLLRGSLRLNLTYGAQDADPDALNKLIDTCGLTELVERLNGGLNALLAENGEGLSTGERARIALVRALMAEPRVLILDEAEANLDDAASSILKQIFDSYPGTIIAATHELDYARAADQVIRMRNGKVAAAGPPEEILNPLAVVAMTTNVPGAN
jgi:ATP-binding cassette, subfamily B, bacterial